MESTEWSDWLEKIWEYREETIYPEFFGELEGEGIYTLSADTFLKTFGQETFDPRWLFYGVLIYQPSAKRNSWLYVTSGMSNPWDDEAQYARENDGEKLVELLARAGAFPVTDPARKSVISTLR